MKKWTRALYQPGLPLGKDGRRVTASPAHIALSKEAAKEGMVLLKNENETLPLKKGAKVALFGKATFDYVKGGGGSGDVTVPYARNLYEGFHCLNCVDIFEPLADFYRGFVEEQYRQGLLPGQATEPTVPAELLNQAEAFADTAIVSICRFSGEGDDRPKEDFYLSAEEKKLVQTVAEHFSCVIAVLNIGGVISAEWFRTEPRIQAALLAWQGGIEGGLAAAELLCGLGNPCGKLADTFAKNLVDYPSTASFGESDDYVEYTEDIYVGYRYFETIPGAGEKVAYPFGYGLSYTTFDIQCLKGSVNGYEEPCFVLRVKNTGSTGGKEVVQLYVDAPGRKIETPDRKLIDFAKTPLLAPGESCTLSLAAPLRALASYDECGVIEKSAWVVEEGSYHFYVGNSVESVKEVFFTERIGESAGKHRIGEGAGNPQIDVEKDWPEDEESLWGLSHGRIYLKKDIVTELCSQKMAPMKNFPGLRSDGNYTYCKGQKGDPATNYLPNESASLNRQPVESISSNGSENKSVEDISSCGPGNKSVEGIASNGSENKSVEDISSCGSENKSVESISSNGPENKTVENISVNLSKVLSEDTVLSEETGHPDSENQPGLRPLKWEEMECVIPATRQIPRRCFLLKEERVPQLIDVYRTRQEYGRSWSPASERPARTIHGEEDGIPFTCEPLTLAQFVESLPDQALAELLGGQPNTGVANTYGVGNLPRYGVPNIMTADGPAGLRIEKRCGVTTTAWPCATMLACTWNPELVSQVGQAAAREVKENNIGIWLAPAVNIHRNPLCGRNFEYYSEDPLLAGRIGAGMVRGIQSQHIAATVKHFALNNKEHNRKDSDSRASERAIREIYLKAFEIIVKEAQPWAIMSSYNLINGTRASEQKDMLTGILRDEWGYEGVVMTDWWAFSEEYKEILAGNDLKMGCGYPERLLEAMEKGLVRRKDLERSAARVLELILKID